MTVLTGRHIELWVEPRGGAAAVNPVMQALLGELARNGANVRSRVLEQELVDPDVLFRRTPDLVLLKSPTTLATAVAVAGEKHGLRCLNTAAATVRAHDKAAALALLARAGVPVPETVLVDPSTNGKPASSPGAWVVKPVRGVHGLGVQAAPSFAGALTAAGAPLAGLVVDDGARLLQREVGEAACEVKVYAAGDVVFAGRKRFAPRSYASDSIEPVDVDAAMVELVSAAREALDLRLLGVDLRFEDGRPLVVDANPFPGFRGFAAAVAPLVAEVVRAL